VRPNPSNVLWKAREVERALPEVVVDGDGGAWAEQVAKTRHQTENLAGVTVRDDCETDGGPHAP
jgi:hypothetical protein